MGIWALLCVATGTLSAQYTVSGTVSDERTGEPLLYANVVIQNSAKGTVTDLDGKFSLEVDSDGEVSLVISTLGYLTQIIKVSPSNRVIDVKLREEIGRAHV